MISYRITILRVSEMSQLWILLNRTENVSTCTNMAPMPEPLMDSSESCRHAADRRIFHSILAATGANILYMYCEEETVTVTTANIHPNTTQNQFLEAPSPPGAPRTPPPAPGPRHEWPWHLGTSFRSIPAVTPSTGEIFTSFWLRPVQISSTEPRSEVGLLYPMKMTKSAILMSGFEPILQ